jgi:hypothetical protein
MTTYITFLEIWGEADRALLDYTPSVLDTDFIMKAIGPTLVSHAVSDVQDMVGKEYKVVEHYRGHLVYVEGGHVVHRYNCNCINQYAEGPRHGEVEQVYITVNGGKHNARVQYKIVRE